MAEEAPAVTLVNEQHQASVTGTAAAPATNGKSHSKLRYPLRSASKLKGDIKTSPAVNDSTVSGLKRARPASIVSQSVSVLDLSGKDKSVSSRKPPRRLSIPFKSAAAGPRLKTITHTATPMPEGRMLRRSIASYPSKTNDASRSDTLKTPTRQSKFDLLTSTSYWIRQVELSESAAKHSVSLGFFKLALEAGVKPMQRMRDELKSYIRKHNLSEFGEIVKPLLESYEISETMDKLQVSVTCSQVHEESNQSSNEEVVQSTNSTAGTRKLRTRSDNNVVPKAVSTKQPLKKDSGSQKAAAKVRASMTKSSKPATESVTGNKIQKLSKKKDTPQHNIDEQKFSSVEEVDDFNAWEVLNENKENKDAVPEEVSAN